MTRKKPSTRYFATIDGSLTLETSAFTQDLRFLWERFGVTLSLRGERDALEGIAPGERVLADLLQRIGESNILEFLTTREGARNDLFYPFFENDRPQFFTRTEPVDGSDRTGNCQFLQGVTYERAVPQYAQSGGQNEGRQRVACDESVRTHRFDPFSQNDGTQLSTTRKGAFGREYSSRRFRRPLRTFPTSRKKHLRRNSRRR